MESSERVNQFKDLFEREYHSKILDNIRLGKKRVVLDFNTIIRHNPDLASDLQDYPEDTLKAAEQAIRESYSDSSSRFRVRIRGDIPNSLIRLRDLRKEHLDKLITIEGTIETKTNMSIKMVSIDYECPNCGAVFKTLQIGDSVSEPSMCSCGRKGKFRTRSSENMDCYSMRLQELSHSIKYGSDLQTKSVLCTEDLTDTIIEERLVEGVKIKINGVYKSKMVTKGGSKQTQLITYIEANYIQISDESYYDIEINEEDVEEIKKFSKQPDLIEKIATGLFQGVYGNEKIKEGLTIQAFGGVSDYESVPAQRGEINILLVGDPGENKTVFCEYATKFNPKNVIAVGKSVSPAGLIGGVVKDELTGSFVLKPGAIPLANNGLCIIDEIDKLNPEDREILLEPMDSQRISITKVVNRKMRARCSFLMTMNPKNDFFNDYDIPFYKQIDLQQTIIDRYDLIYILKRNTDNSDKALKSEEEKARIIMTRSDKSKQQELSSFHKFIMKYIAYARQNINPVFDGYLKEEYIPKRYAKFNIGKRPNSLDKEKGDGWKIGTRKLPAIKRIAEARRRIFLDNKVTSEDIDYAIGKIEESLMDYALDVKTGRIDDSYATIGVPSEKKKLIEQFEEVCDKIKKDNGDHEVEDLIREMEILGFKESDVMAFLEKKRKYGDIIFPRGHRAFVRVN